MEKTFYYLSIIFAVGVVIVGLLAGDNNVGENPDVVATVSMSAGICAAGFAIAAALKSKN